MKIKVAILFIIGVLVVAFTVFSVYYYRIGRNDQYDEYILKYSKLEGEPGLKPVDPAIVKAIISVRTNFNPFITGPNGEKGLMSIPEEGVEKFKDYHGEGDFIIVTPENEKKLGYVCPNRHFPDHKKAHELYFRAVNCPVCGRRTVEAIIDPEVNARIGTWYLAYITAYIEENIEGIDGEDLLNFSIFVYLSGLETLFTDIEAQLRSRVKGFENGVPREATIRALKPYLDSVLRVEQVRADIDKIKKEAERFRPRLEKKAHNNRA